MGLYACERHLNAFPIARPFVHHSFPVFVTVALRDDDLILLPVTKNDNGKLSIGMKRNHHKDPWPIYWASITKVSHKGTVLPTCNWMRKYIPHLWDNRDRIEQRAYMSVPVIQQIASSRLDLYLPKEIERPSFLPSHNVRLFTFQDDTKLGGYLCRAWLHGHRRHVACIPVTLEPKSVSANLRYVERVINVLDQGDERDGGCPHDKQAVSPIAREQTRVVKGRHCPCVCVRFADRPEIRLCHTLPRLCYASFRGACWNAASCARSR